MANIDLSSLEAAAHWLVERGVDLPEQLLSDMYEIGAFKTMDYFKRVLRRLTRDLYGGKLTKDEFVRKADLLITGQVYRAWWDGMGACGLGKDDLTDEMKDIITEIHLAEREYLDGLADAILATDDYRTVYPRINLWVNRFKDVRNRARVLSCPDVLFTWVLGATEDHCSDCLSYAGQSRTGADWQKIYAQTGHRPQSPSLECGGWQCDCDLVKV